MTDYYALLGVPDTADLAAITAAYRLRAMADHPDRGGSHEKMILLNEAFDILRDPDTRARYDAARKAAPDTPDQARVRDDARRARERAETYPCRWDDFERWLDRARRDFDATEFRQGAGPGAHQMIPTSTTASGNLFIFVGGVIGVVLLFYPILGVLGPNARGMYLVMFAVVVPFVLGAWGGILAHKAVGGTLNLFGPGHPSASPPSEAAPAATRVVACGACGQKLRVPVMREELVVTCTACGHKFPLPPE